MNVPLFWRLLGVNLVVVLGGALVGTWLTQRLVVSSGLTHRHRDKNVPFVGAATSVEAA